MQYYFCSIIIKIINSIIFLNISMAFCAGEESNTEVNDKKSLFKKFDLGNSYTRNSL